MPTVLKFVSRGALVGAAAALLVALGDIGASWQWLSNSNDRIELGLRVLGIVVPIGALVGALLGGLEPLAARLTRRWAARLGGGTHESKFERRLWPWPFVLLASPALGIVAWLLFTGGSASKLPMRPLLVAVAALVLIGGSYVAVRIGRALALAAPSMSRGRAWPTIAALFALHFGMAWVNQTILPGLYGYLHALLAVGSWLVAALALAMVAVRSPRLIALDSRTPAIGLTMLAILLGVLVVDVGTLARNQTVRVALLSPRAAASRSLMLGIAPLLASFESRAAADAAEIARRARRGRRLAMSEGGPTLEGAHVLLVTIDALRADHLGLYGYRTRPVSPELDKFAEEAVVFETAYATAPHSSYSLCSLMASDYLYQRIQLGLPFPTETLAGVLGAVGYHTSASYIEGVFHTDGEAMEQFRVSKFGFAETSHANLDADRKTDLILERVQRIVEAGEPPALLWAHYFDVHEPYRDTTFGTTDIERYDGEIRKVDRAFGRLIREVRARVTRPVIVVITADHGEEFRDHGGVYHGSTVYQEQIRVPLLVHVPGIAPRRVATPVETIDVAPTLLGLLGVPVAPSMQGKDLRPLFVADEERGPVFASAGTKHMVVDWPYKLIADLRFGTRELYDLVEDPRERENLANAQPERVTALEGELQAWLDSLSDSALDPSAAALYRGRLADQSAAPALGALMLDEEADSAMRVEAARLLANIQHPEVVPSLRKAVRASDPDVAAEALISLAWLGQDPARGRLVALLEGGNLERRVRAAVGLGRLRDRAATPVLIEALDKTDAIEERIRFEAIRLLGYLGDPRAVDPLLARLDDMRTRRRAVLALGRIGDPRAFEPLVEQLLNAQHTTVRDSAARALAHLGNPQAIPSLVRAAVRDRLPGVSEALIRLRAVGEAIGGVDVRPGLRGAEGLVQCRSATDDREEWNFLERTTCETEGSRASVPVALPNAVREASASVLLVRMRRIDAGATVPVRVSIGERTFDPVRVDGEWAEQRFPLGPSELSPRVTIEAEGEARLALDHVLIVPER